MSHLKDTDTPQYVKGAIDIQYYPTICQKCNKVLTHTYVEQEVSQPEILYHVLCNECWDKLW